MIKQSEQVKQMVYASQSTISEDSCKAIILDTIMDSKDALTLHKLTDSICNLFHVLVNKERLEKIFNALVVDEILMVNEDSTLEITPKHLAEQRIKKLEYESIKKKAAISWIDLLCSTDDIPDESRQGLNDSLFQFIDTVFLRHGVVSYEFLTNQSITSDFNIKEIATEIAQKVQTSQQELIAKSLPRIFEMSNDLEVMTYLKQTINKAIGYISEVFSEETALEISKSLKELTLYLDTNMLYRILNLQGDERFEATKEALSFLRENGVKLRVSSLTKKELSSRIKYDSKILQIYPTKVNLAQLGYNYRSEDNFISTFWRQRSQGKLSLVDFIAYYTNHDIILNQFGIEVEFEEISNDSFLVEVEELFLKLSKQDWRSDKNRDSLWHDAYNMAYVRKMQKSDAKTPIDSGVLFLTADSSLLKIQTNDIELKQNLPISITPTKLLQIFSFTTPENGYEETYIHFFASSSLGSKDYSNEEVQEIISRMSHYSDLDESVAEQVLCRLFIDKRYRDSEDVMEREEIVYNTISEEMVNSLERVKKQNTEQEITIHSLKQDSRAMDDLMREQSEIFERETEKLRLEQIELDKNRELEIDILKEENVTTAKKLDEARQQKDKGENIYISEKLKRWRWRCFAFLGFGLMVILAALGLCAYLLFCTKAITILEALAISTFAFTIGAALMKNGKSVLNPEIVFKVREVFIEEYRSSVKL
ncbi:MAG: hypothetical protein R3Y07_06265 [Eubacteriales bacterium]